MRQQIFKKTVLRGQLGVVLDVVDQLPRSKIDDLVKLNSPAHWLPLEVEQLVERVGLLPTVASQIHASPNHPVIVAADNTVLVLGLLLVSQRVIVRLLQRLHLALYKPNPLRLKFVSRIYILPRGLPRL